MSKDHENVPVSLSDADEGPAARPVQPFKHEQMVSCESCLRNNPPTRANCLYCGANLPVQEASMDLQKPALRQLEPWEQGYNNILDPTAMQDLTLTERPIADAADLLKLETTSLGRILSSKHALPVARSGSSEEALLIQRRLRNIGIETRIVADADLIGDNNGPFRVRALKFHGDGFKAYERPASEPTEFAWSAVVLLVAGRLTAQRLETREEKVSRNENRILDSSEFYSDETILDFYAATARPFRILAKSFDFSCLGQSKGLLAEENMSTLLKLFRENASNANWDDSYNSVRKALEAVWPSERQNHSTGWRRDRPGKISKGIATEINNEPQFDKYSRLCRHLRDLSMSLRKPE